MAIWDAVKRLFSVDDSILGETFSLGNRGEDDGVRDGKQGEGAPDRAQSESHRGKERERPKDHEKKEIRHPVKLEELAKAAKAEKHTPSREKKGEDGKDPIAPDIAEVEDFLKDYFLVPRNKDIIIRPFLMPASRPRKGLVVFVDGLADKMVINTGILEPLMMFVNFDKEHPQDASLDHMEEIMQRVLPGNQVDLVDTYQDAATGILMGSTGVFLEGCTQAAIVETKGWEHRFVSIPVAEQVIRGPHDAFNEMLRANTGLIRSRFRSPKLVTEMFKVGKLSGSDVALMYVEGVANPKLVEEVRRRIHQIDTDNVSDTGALEQYLEDPPRSLVPKILETERPDRVCEFLAEGHVALLMSGSPAALILPITFWGLFHTSEDAYLRWPFGSFIRVIRFVSIFIALLLPALYIATTNYHPEMIPTDLLLAIAAAREKVPFPVVGEVLLMEFSIELIREAGIRIPSVIGPTIGIVGALILGQAAVAAGIVSPLLVIVVAVTALASFAMPNYNLSFAVRIGRFVFLILGAVFGFYGIALGLVVTLGHLVNLKSFGVPLLSPVAPFRRGNPDTILRGSVYEQERRPAYMRAEEQRMQEEVVRDWSPDTKKIANQTKNKELWPRWMRRKRGDDTP
jgi:spore germination protein KA